MKRVLLSLCLVVFVYSSTVDAQQHRKKSTHATTQASSTSANVTDITECPDQGIGGDPNLNRRKNIRSNNGTPTLRTVQWMKNLADPTNFTRQNTGRAPLARLGEGRK